MATIINTPAREGDGTGLITGIAILAVLVFLLIYFGIPALRGMDSVQVNVSDPEVSVPAPVNKPEARDLITP